MKVQDEGRSGPGLSERCPWGTVLHHQPAQLEGQGARGQPGPPPCFRWWETQSMRFTLLFLSTEVREIAVRSKEKPQKASKLGPERADKETREHKIADSSKDINNSTIGRTFLDLFWRV